MLGPGASPCQPQHRHWSALAGDADAWARWSPRATARQPAKTHCQAFWQRWGCAHGLLTGAEGTGWTAAWAARTERAHVRAGAERLRPVSWRATALACAERSGRRARAGRPSSCRRHARWPNAVRASLSRASGLKRCEVDACVAAFCERRADQQRMWRVRARS